jgi:hypothetical protein
MIISKSMVFILVHDTWKVNKCDYDYSSIVTQNLMLKFWSNGFYESLQFYHSMYRISSSQIKWKAENFPNVKESWQKANNIAEQMYKLYVQFWTGLAKVLTIYMFTECCHLICSHSVASWHSAVRLSSRWISVNTKGSQGRKGCKLSHH